jgi:hypothetical protein
MDSRESTQAVLAGPKQSMPLSAASANFSVLEGEQ